MGHIILNTLTHVYHIHTSGSDTLNPGQAWAGFRSILPWCEGGRADSHTFLGVSGKADSHTFLGIGEGRLPYLTVILHCTRVSLGCLHQASVE